MRLSRKLSLGYIVITLFVGLAGYLVVNISQKALEGAIINDTTTLASKVIEQIDREIYSVIKEFRAYSQDLLLVEVVARSNREFDAIADRQGYLDRMDKLWSSARTDALMPFLNELLDNRLSREMQGKTAFNENLSGFRGFGEIFVTNKYGAVAGLTNKTSDYRQDDETWWQNAKNDGLYVSGVDFDESSGVQSVDIAIRIDDEYGDFKGVIKVVLNIETVFEIIKGLEHDSHTRYILTTREGELLFPRNGAGVPGRLPQNIMNTFHMKSGKSFIAEKTVGAGTALFVHAQSTGYRDFKGLGWMLLVEHDTAEVFAPVSLLKQIAYLISTLAVATAITLGLVISRSIARPVENLRKAASRLGSGDLDARVDVVSRDELGVLGMTFNQMADDLKKTTVSMDRLSEEVKERKVAEEALRESDENYRNLAEGLTGVVYRANPQTLKPTFVNRAVEDIYGYTREEWLGDPQLWEKTVHPDDVGMVVENILEAVKTRKATSIVYRVIRKNGAVRWVEDRFSIEKDRLGRSASLNGFRYDITERKKAEELTERHFHRLRAMRSIYMAISGSRHLRLTLDVILENVMRELAVDAADILLLRHPMNILEYGAGRGFRTDALQYTNLEIGASYAGRAAFEKKTVCVENIGTEPGEFKRSALLGSEGFITYYGTPLVSKGEVHGVLEVFTRTRFKPEHDWLAFLEMLAGQAAIALDNAVMFEGLQRSQIELTTAYDATIEGWARALDLRDKETEGHSRRVTEMTVKTAEALGVSPERFVHFRRGALLHDIGKMGVPDSILLKPGKLDEQEWFIMSKHPEHAFKMLSPIEFLRLAIDIPYCHHEKWDGTGYPRGLKGEEIPLSARIFAVVDIFDALCSDRPYRQAWPLDKVVSHIESLKGTHLDPSVSDAFLGLIRDDIFGHFFQK